jgi:hypothetical protein
LDALDVTKTVLLILSIPPSFAVTDKVTSYLPSEENVWEGEDPLAVVPSPKSQFQDSIPLSSCDRSLNDTVRSEVVNVKFASGGESGSETDTEFVTESVCPSASVIVSVTS